MRTSRRIHPSFILAKGRSPGFASAPADSAPCSDSLSLRLRAFAPLTSPATATRRFIMQKARRHPGIPGSDRLQAHGFRVCFTPLLEVLFTFPSRYLCAIGLSVVFSLAGWSPPIPAEFLVFRGTQVPSGLGPRISHTGLSPSSARLSCLFRYAPTPAPPTVLQPRAARNARPRFGLLRVRSPLLAQSLLFSLPAGTKMFQFPAFAPRHQARRRDRSRRVPPFGHPRITGHLPLPAAFRSLSRPSSPPRATGIPRAPLFAFLFSRTGNRC